jgi:uncharacterized DUF497 family protein
MDFEWDLAKEAANVAKHGITFTDAASVFDDPHHLTEDSTKPEYGEERSLALGMVAERLVAVIYTDREQRRRIISARRARKNERERYDHSKTTP